MKYFDPKSLMTERMIASGNFQEIIEDLTDRIPQEIAEMLMREQNDPDNLLLIHRTARVDAQRIFEQGLTIAEGNNLDYTTSRCASNLVLMISINAAANYKNPGGMPARAILAKIPKTAVKYEPGVTKPILQVTKETAEQSGGFMVISGKYQTRLLPEYILGSIEYQNDEIVGFIKNSRYRSIHNHSNEGLICTQEVIYDYIYQNEALSKENIDFDMKMDIANERMIEENTKMMSKASRSEEEMKQYAFKDLVVSHLKSSIQGIKEIFHKDREI